MPRRRLRHRRRESRQYRVRLASRSHQRQDPRGNHPACRSARRRPGVASHDTGALIALEAGSRSMALRVEQAMASGAELAIPAGVVAQAWRGGARQVRIAKLLQLQVTSIVPLDTKLALR